MPPAVVLRERIDMGAKVHMFVLNNFTRDTRVLREAKALIADGHDVTVFAVLDNQTREHEVVEGIRVRRMRGRPL